jgi:hypothetical protein
MEIDLSAIRCDPANDNIADDGEDMIQDYDEIPLPPGPTEAEIEAEEDAAAEEKFGQNRKRLLLLIQMYINEFPKKLSAYKGMKLEKLSNKELEKLFEEIKFTLGARNNIQAGVKAMCLGINLFEQIAVKNPYMTLRVQGLSQICADEDTIDDMKEICLKHMDLVRVEPEARLGFKIVSTALMLHQINPAPAAPQSTETPSPTISPEASSAIASIGEKYSDL